MARRTAKEAEALKERIVDEALRLFGERGLEATSIAAVARAVGISKQALMHHYPSKDALEDAIQDRVEASFDDMLPSLVAAFTAQDTELDDILRELIAALDRHRPLARYMVRRVLLEPAVEIPPSGQAFTDLQLDYLRRGQADGRLRQDFEPEDALFHLGMLFMVTHIASAVPGTTGRDLSIPELRLRRQRELIRIIKAALLPPDC